MNVDLPKEDWDLIISKLVKYPYEEVCLVLAKMADQFKKTEPTSAK